MRMRLKIGVACGLLTLVSTSVGLARGMAEETGYTCSDGSHVYAICPNLGYCASGGETVCEQICPEASHPITSSHCTAFGQCESLQCTFGQN